VAEPSVEPGAGQLARLSEPQDDAEVVMVNLLRFKDEADGIDQGLSGAEAFGRYSRAVAPMLERIGGEVISAVSCRQGVIGPEEAEWHMVIQVRYPSKRAFLEMVTDPAYREIHDHRLAALADSRLILSKQVA
jgi:uncharacterized protein (DUF1330 family)